MLRVTVHFECTNEIGMRVCLPPKMAKLNVFFDSVNFYGIRRDLVS